MIHTFMEEYFRCIVSVGTFWFAPEVRSYLVSQYPKEAEAIETMQVGALMHRAQREVSYKEGAARLKGILAVLTNAGPFANDWAEGLCTDLVAVRNIITHQGGWPTESDVPTVKSSHVLVADASVPSVRFYRLTIGKQFVVAALSALVLSSLSMETALRNDSRYRS